MLNSKLIAVLENSIRNCLGLLLLITIIFSNFALADRADFLKVLNNSANSSVSFYAEDLSARQESLAVNPDRAATPASLTKILTSFYALSEYGKNFQFETEFFLQNAGATNSKLIISASGAPDLVIEDLFLIARKLRQLGLTHIAELQIVMPNAFDEALIGPEAYQAQTSAWPLNYNSIAIEICPASSAGKPAAVSTDLPELTPAILNTVNTAQKIAQPLVVDVQYSTQKSAWTVAVSGQVLAGEACQIIYKSLPEAKLAVAPVLTKLLTQQGVQVQKYSTLASYDFSNLTPFYVHNSRPLSEVVFRMNRFSSNLISKQLGFLFSAKAGSANFSEGVAALEDYYKSNFPAAKSLALFDASGLDRKNKISPKLLVEVLRTAAKDPKINAEFQSSLVMPGEGTMRNRTFKNVATLRAKTGYINGVSGLSGYLQTSSGSLWAFALMQNGVVAREAALEFEEQLIARFYQDF